MTREETKKVLMIVDASYPNFKVDNPTETLNAWHYLLQDYNAEEIVTGLKFYIATSGSAFAPSVSELIAASKKPKELQGEDAVTAWAQVRNAIRDSIYNAEEHYALLSDTAKKVVGSPSQLRSWGQMEGKEIDSVVASNFKRNYEVVQKREREISSLPQNIRDLIEQNSQNLIGRTEE